MLHSAVRCYPPILKHYAAWLATHLQVNLRTMNRLARILRAKRAERGALQLASPEVKFEIDTETHDPLDVGMYQVCERFRGAGGWGEGMGRGQEARFAVCRAWLLGRQVNSA